MSEKPDLYRTILFERDGKYTVYEGDHSPELIKKKARKHGIGTTVWLLVENGLYESFYHRLAQDIVNGSLIFADDIIILNNREIRK